jgi:hypothetical protein
MSAGVRAVSRAKGNNILEDNTMESKKDWLIISVLTVAVGIIFTGCSQPTDNDPTYTVWTDSGTYTEFQSAFDVATLLDDHYVHTEITDAQFSQIPLPNEYKQNWNESQIYNWFIGRGFGDTEANREKSWLITVIMVLLPVETEKLYICS